MFFLLPIGVNYQARRYPVVTFTLMGVNAVFYLYVNGAQVRPFARSKVIDMLAMGSIQADAQFRRDGMAEWRPVAEL